MDYRFFGWQTADLPAITTEYKGIQTPRDLYDALSEVWCRETCAVRMRMQWTKDNMTLGQCSITAFLVQDVFGGDVYGVPLEDGNFHCFNDVDGHIFDLTSEQFGDVVLDYSTGVPQSREIHFSKDDKKERYELLKKRLKQKLGMRLGEETHDG